MVIKPQKVHTLTNMCCEKFKAKDSKIKKSYLIVSIPVCQVGKMASETWKFSNLLSMTNEKVFESVPH